MAFSSLSTALYAVGKPIVRSIINTLKTNQDDLFFEDTSVGRLKKKIWEASEEEISRILEDYGIPSPSELGKPGTYIQNTIRQQFVENRKKNDILFIPIGCTELHGRHTVTGLDTFMVT